MKSINAQAGLASIIVPCWNQLEFTRHCVNALRRYTRQPWELVVIDNGSTDGTRDYLAGVQDMSPVPVTIVANDQNLGFPAAINQGLQRARGENLVLLNNDVVVTEAWLDHLIALASASTGDEGEGFTPESNGPTREGGRLDLTVIDLNEVGAGIARPCAPPPQTPPPQRGGRISLDVGVRLASTIGLVGPMSNYAAPPQLVQGVPYSDLGEMHVFARRWRDEHLGKWFTVPKLSGFCMLMKRAVYEAIGGLDERFGLGLFDDDDLAERARRAGFELAVAHDLFVHHFGSRTFVGNGVDAEKLLDENEQRFTAKWGLPRIHGDRVMLKPFPNRPRNGSDVAGLGKGSLLPRINADGRGSEIEDNGRACRVETAPGVAGADPARQRGMPAQAGPRSTADRLAHASGWYGEGHRRAEVRSVGVPTHGAGATGPQETASFAFSSAADRRSSATIRGKKPCMASAAAKVSLTMIVRDEATNLPICLKSVEGVFDEIIIVDTGSTDGTVDIARSFGARVFDFVWVDDFAAARNAALARATGDYAFWLDADDVVDPPQRAKLVALLKELKAGEEAACVVRCACDPSPDGTGGDTVVDHIRLFPVREDVRWTYRVHEQILPALRRAKVPVRWTDLVVRHTGYVDRELRLRKLQRDSKILMEELAERPDDPFVLFNRGAIAIEMRDWRGALDFLRRSLKGSARTDSITRKLFALIARSHQMLGEPAQALSACASGLEIDPEDAELLFREAVVRRHINDNDGAEKCWRRILGLRRSEQFSSVDQGIYGHLTRRNLAALAEERGDRLEAAKLWGEILAECPGDREAMAMLAQ
jgi:GT2 family glycosyltransferase